LNQQLLASIRNLLLNQTNQQSPSESAKQVQSQQIQSLINTLVAPENGQPQDPSAALQALRKSLLSGNTNGASTLGGFQQTKQNELLQAQQTPLNQLLSI